jgi:hypothetical protein
MQLTARIATTVMISGCRKKKKTLPAAAALIMQTLDDDTELELFGAFTSTP